MLSLITLITSLSISHIPNLSVIYSFKGGAFDRISPSGA